MSCCPSHRGEIRVDEERCGRDGCQSHPEGHQCSLVTF